MPKLFNPPIRHGRSSPSSPVAGGEGEAHCFLHRPIVFREKTMGLPRRSGLLDVLRSACASDPPPFLCGRATSLLLVLLSGAAPRSAQRTGCVHAPHTLRTRTRTRTPYQRLGRRRKAALAIRTTVRHHLRRLGLSRVPPLMRTPCAFLRRPALSFPFLMEPLTCNPHCSLKI